MNAQVGKAGVQHGAATQHAVEAIAQQVHLALAAADCQL